MSQNGSRCYARHCRSRKNSESPFCDFHQCTVIDCKRKKYFMKKYNNQDAEYTWSRVCYKHKCQFETTPGAWYQRTFCLNERGFDSDYCDKHACNFCPNKIYQEDVEVCSEHRCKTRKGKWGICPLPCVDEFSSFCEKHAPIPSTGPSM